MPELPEVETVRRGLEPHVVGGFIDDIQVADSKILQVEPHRLLEQVRGQKILGLTRRGKFLIFELERHYFIFHFGMTGQLTFRDPNRSDEGFKRHPVTGLQAHSSACSRSAYPPANPSPTGRSNAFPRYPQVWQGLPH